MIHHTEYALFCPKECLMDCGKIISIYERDHLLGREGQGRDGKEGHIESKQ